MAIFKGSALKDTLTGGIGNDVLYGYGDDDILNGSAGNDVLNGSAGNDSLDGGLGVDTLNGGFGDDTYIVDNINDVINEAVLSGMDTVNTSISWKLGANLENLVLTSSNTINGTGNTLANAITGNPANNLLKGYAGDDTLDGGLGVDTLNGGFGDDTYIVDNVNDVINEAVLSGMDTVDTLISWTLGANLENLVLTGTNTINGTGNTLANAVTGNPANNLLKGDAGDDTLYGGSGNDTLNGGSGNDTYIVDNVNNIIKEAVASGKDMVNASVSWTLNANLENLVLTGIYTINGTGNTLANTIIGNSANNILSGGASNDSLEGGLGIDTLNSGIGNDILGLTDFVGDLVDGGTGTDKLQISGNNQIIDIRTGTVKNVEVIKLTDDSNSTLKVTAQSVLNLSSDSDILKVDANGNNTLIMETGWTDKGLIKGYQNFTKDGATLKVNPAITHIETTTSLAYTISDAASAKNVKNAFTSGADEITIDFGGKAYKDTGLISINLKGFGLEDKLIIAQHDGNVNNGVARYNYSTSHRNSYIAEFSSYWSSGSLSTSHYYSKYDRVSWQEGATAAHLVSTQIDVAEGRNPYHATKIGMIGVVGLPTGLPDSQFVFV